MERTKLYKLIIAALVVINVSMLVLFFMSKPPHGGPKPGQLVKQLGLEGSNQEFVIELEKEHHFQKRKLIGIDRKLHEELFEKIGTKSDVSELQIKIDSNYSEMEKMTYSFFHEVSKRCNAEQKEKLKKTIHHAFRQMRKPRRR